MREREEGSPTYFKALKLIVPERVQALGYPAEGPVFVSPDISGEEACEICGVIYTPLVYQVGFVVRSQHYHEEGGVGGIYYVDTGRFPFSFSYNIKPSPWIAVLNLLGRRDKWRSEAVEMKGIKALCIDRECMLELNKGIVISLPTPTRPDELFPLCGVDQHPQVTLTEEFEVNPNGRWHSERFSIREISLPPRPVFNFRITPNGRMVFGNLQQI